MKRFLIPAVIGLVVLLVLVALGLADWMAGLLAFVVFLLCILSEVWE